jgi:hypothetical protein
LDDEDNEAYNGFVMAVSSLMSTQKAGFYRPGAEDTIAGARSRFGRADGKLPCPADGTRRHWNESAASAASVGFAAA